MKPGPNLFLRLVTCALLVPPTLGTAQPSDPVADLDRSAQADFPRLPQVTISTDLSDLCGGDVLANAIYCTSEQAIYITTALHGTEAAPYLVAHLLGHGLQVRYGIADFALAAIGAAPEREAELRGMVERQNDCFAGMLLARADLPLPDLAALFDDDPLAGAHWGRSPVRNGPQLHVPLEDRAEWLAKGYAAATPDACTVGEVAADLIVEADQRD